MFGLVTWTSTTRILDSLITSMSTVSSLQNPAVLNTCSATHHTVSSSTEPDAKRYSSTYHRRGAVDFRLFDAVCQVLRAVRLVDSDIQAHPPGPLADAAVVLAQRDVAKQVPPLVSSPAHAFSVKDKHLGSAGELALDSPCCRTRNQQRMHTSGTQHLGR